MAQNKKGNKGGGSKMAGVATFASGLVVGIVVAPYVKQAFQKYAPSIDGVADKVAKSAGKVFERGSDIVAEAKDQLAKEK